MTSIKHDCRVNSMDGRFMQILRWAASLVRVPQKARRLEASSFDFWRGGKPIDGALYAFDGEYDQQAFGDFAKAWTTAYGLRQEAIRPGLSEAGTVEALAQSYLDREDEDYTWVDPEDIRRLARAVLKCQASS